MAALSSDPRSSKGKATLFASVFPAIYTLDIYDTSAYVFYHKNFFTLFCQYQNIQLCEHSLEIRRNPLISYQMFKLYSVVKVRVHLCIYYFLLSGTSNNYPYISNISKIQKRTATHTLNNSGIDTGENKHAYA